MNNKEKEFFYTDFNSLGNIVNSVVQNTNLRQGMKKATVFKFWPQVVGKKFEKYSKIEALNNQGVLLVSCANSAVSSELTMFKSDILRKINVYANPLGIEIIDINFSHKIWKKDAETSYVVEDAKNPHKKDLTGFNPENIDLDDDEVSAIRDSVMNNKFATEEQRKKMFDAIILDLKAQKFCSDKLKKITP